MNIGGLWINTECTSRTPLLLEIATILSVSKPYIYSSMHTPCSHDSTALRLLISSLRSSHSHHNGDGPMTFLLRHHLTSTYFLLFLGMLGPQKKKRKNSSPPGSYPRPTWTASAPRCSRALVRCADRRPTCRLRSAGRSSGTAWRGLVERPVSRGDDGGRGPRV